MRYLSAYVLSTLGGNKDPSLSDIEAILGSVGIDADKEKANKVISELKGKDINQLIKSGLTKLATIPTGGVAAAVPAATATATAAASAAPAVNAAPADSKKEAKKEEKQESEESDEDMGFSLFD